MLFGNQVIRKIIVTLTLCLLTTLTFASESVQVVKATLGTGKAATDVTGQVKAIVASILSLRCIFGKSEDINDSVL